MKIPYSVLDLATVIQGKAPADTFKNSVALAQHVEKLGYTRYWFAEHHNMVSVASSATSVLIGHIAGNTEKIRVGSGGIMLPNHSPLIVAEQFGTLATLYPNRIDLGLGRAPGTDQLTAMEIRGGRFSDPHSFPQDVLKLQKYLSNDNSQSKVRAIPGEGTEVPIWILGSSTESAHLAASYGLPYAFASHFAPAYFLEAINIYRQNFRPSATLKEPYVMSCVNVVAADTDAEAERLATSLKQLFMGIVTGQRKLLQPPINNMDEIWNDMEEAAVNQMLSVAFIGGSKKLTAQLQSFRDQTKIDEIMVTSHIYDHEARLYSYQLFADIMKSL
ncbi:LLM class flavin-dependent oxidoreductase [Pedobacter boryungensis]|uniref:LLM class flavin-dependent oxidoreductase n=1 Tax=Pedobacter boryungensis TaxID=869962 RepID=A0ABX2D9G0_9SPHI|nr:LLM class flavin-dependent oxidoreductase [Pedobacter boryungensis]NQX30657.1 LLM class flavin-dependent oxidoreductase [Pedobacter boryungensis]